MSNRSEKPAKKRGGSHAKRRKVRYDRIAVVVIPLILIIVLIVLLCVRGCSKSKDNTPKNTAVTTASQQSGADETTTTAPDTATSTTSLTTTTAEKASDSEKVKLSASGVKEGSLILVNSEHALQLSQEELNLKNVYEASRSGDTVTYRVGYTDFLMDADALEHLGEMMDDFYTATGYSSLEVFGGDYAETQTGLSFNLKINFGDGTSDYYNAEKYPDYSWISEHAAEYGFVVRYPEDKDEYTGQSGRSYVFRYVGEPHAAYMQEHDLCLEEYLDEVQSRTEKDPLEITVGDTDYKVFYVPVGGTNDVTATVTGAYTASGDNMGGYIVACE